MAERPGALGLSAAREEQERRRNQKTNRMLISMVVAFAICWLPLSTINTLLDVNNQLLCWPYHNFAFFIFHVMAMSSTCYNPFLYGIHNEAFQKEFVAMVPALKLICGGNTSNSRNGAAAGERLTPQVTHTTNISKVELPLKEAVHTAEKNSCSKSSPTQQLLPETQPIMV